MDDLEDLEGQFDPDAPVLAAIDVAVAIIRVCDEDDDLAQEAAFDRVSALFPEDDDDVREMLEITLTVLAEASDENTQLQYVIAHQPRPRWFRTSAFTVGTVIGALAPSLALMISALGR